jgi:hypothetical protein
MFSMTFIVILYFLALLFFFFFLTGWSSLIYCDNLCQTYVVSVNIYIIMFYYICLTFYFKVSIILLVKRNGINVYTSYFSSTTWFLLIVIFSLFTILQWNIYIYTFLIFIVDYKNMFWFFSYKSIGFFPNYCLSHNFFLFSYFDHIIFLRILVYMFTC